MELTEKRRSETWAFYTPRIRAEKAIEYMSRELWDLHNYIFYDPACWEWALLEALPADIEKFGTTLEEEDAKICMEKGLVVDRYDFLRPWAEDFCEWLRSRSYADNKPIVVFTNPPYFKLSKEQYPGIREKYWSNDSVVLFYRRIMEHLRPAWLCGFNKLDLRQAPSMESFREALSYYGKLEKMFVTPSMSRPGLKGRFPIGFNIIQSYWWKLKNLNKQ